jgi:hypothetical protein
VRPRQRQKQGIQRPRPTVRNCSFSAVGGQRHWFHLYHRTRTLPLPVGDQKALPAVQEYHNFKNNVAAAALVSRV